MNTIEQAINKRTQPTMKCASCGNPATPGDGLCKECAKDLDLISWTQDCRKEGSHGHKN